MTEREWQALIQLLNRVPMTLSESMWLDALIVRELAKFKPKENKPAESS